MDIKDLGIRSLKRDVLELKKEEKKGDVYVDMYFNGMNIAEEHEEAARTFQRM